MGSRAEVVIALGANIGNRCSNLSAALKAMQAVGVEVYRHSCLYETAPVGLVDQPNFLNAAVLGATQDAPLTLLKKLKRIETEMGRDQNGQKWGPRPIDLDIIFYGDQRMDTEKCTLPHPRWAERDFVKVPLLDLAGAYSTVRSSASHPVREAMKVVEETPVKETLGDVAQVTSLGKEAVEKLGFSTWIMQILNITPDSFSDGGHLLSQDGQLQKAAIIDSAKSATEILDVGGQSTRPGSIHLSQQEEAERVLPVIKLLRQELGESCPYISIDTFYASVAREAVSIGADLVNDISAGKMDPQMLTTVAELDVPMILMHMRGTPQTMTQRQNCTYSADPVRDVAQELQERAEVAMESGIPAWKLMLDPGIGFAKTSETSFKIFSELHRLKGELLTGTLSKLPLVLGVSRKRFLSRFTGDKSAHERDVVSCAAGLDAVRQGVQILRVHNSEMAQEVLSLADALYRSA